MELMSPALTSCQYVAGQLLETSARSPLKYISILPVLLVLKLLLTMFAQQVRFSQLTQTHAKLPHKLQKLLDKYKIPAHQIKITTQLTFEAYAVGLYNPVIVLSMHTISALPARQLEAVLLHELHHVRNWHPLIFMLGNAISSVCWFLPTLSELSEIIQERCEVAADSFAVTTQGTHQYLVSALETCLRSGVNAQPRLAVAVSPGLHTQLLHQRIAMLTMRHTQTTRTIRPSSVCISTVVLAGLITLTVLKPSLLVQAQAPNECTFTQCVARCVSERLNTERQYSPGLYSPADGE